MPLHHRIAAAVGVGVLALGAAVVSAPFASARPAQASPLSYYGFNRVTTAGAVRDNSHHRRLMHLEGNWRRTSGAAGHQNAIHFGARSVGVIPKSAALIPGRQRFAVAMTVKAGPLSGTSSAHLAQLGFAKDAGRWKMELRPGKGRVSCTFKGSRQEATVTSRRGITDGQFHQVVCFRLGKTIGVQVDGTRARVLHRQVGSIESARTIHIANKSLRTATVQLRGVVDYFAVAVGPRPVARAVAHAPTLP